MSQQASFGQLALIHCGKFLPLEVLQSAAGHYIGTRDTEGPVSRESREYFRSYAAAITGDAVGTVDVIGLAIEGERAAVQVFPLRRLGERSRDRRRGTAGERATG